MIARVLLLLVAAVLLLGLYGAATALARTANELFLAEIALYGVGGVVVGWALGWVDWEE